MGSADRSFGTGPIRPEHDERLAGGSGDGGTDARADGDSERGASRRHFLKTVGALPAAIAAAQGSDSAAAEPGAATLPQIRLGPHSISRLICGANCFNAGSHLSVFVNYEMKRYYTPERILQTLRRCREVGINCWASGRQNYDFNLRLLEEGIPMHYLGAGDPSKLAQLPVMAKAGCIAVAHHGEVTDRLFRQGGNLDQIGDYLKRVHDAGMLAGVGTHIAEVVDVVESKGWEVDYYMTCVYERHRSAEQLRALLGHVPIPVGEVYLSEDPPRMFQAMRQTKHPCLAFKILAAGRLSERKSWVEQAFRETFAGIKPNDAVIVGIYDRYSDQVAENADYVRKYGRV